MTSFLGKSEGMESCGRWVPLDIFFGLVCFGVRAVMLGGRCGTFAGLGCVGRVLRLCWWEGDGGANVCRGCRAMAGRTWFTTAVPLVWSKSLGWFDRGRAFGRISGNHHPMSPSPLAFGHSSCLPAHRPSLSFLASLTFLSTGACLPISFGPVFCSSSPSLRLSFAPAVVLTTRPSTFFLACLSSYPEDDGASSCAAGGGSRYRRISGAFVVVINRHHRHHPPPSLRRLRHHPWPLSVHNIFVIHHCPRLSSTVPSSSSPSTDTIIHHRPIFIHNRRRRWHCPVVVVNICIYWHRLYSPQLLLLTIPSLCPPSSSSAPLSSPNRYKIFPC